MNSIIESVNRISSQTSFGDKKLLDGSSGVQAGIANVTSTFNNTIITITDFVGNTLCWSSAGTVGFKGSRKSTPFAAQSAARNVATKAIEFGMKTVEIVNTGLPLYFVDCFET